MHALLKSTCEIPISTEHSLKLAKQIDPVLSPECRRKLKYMHMQSFDWEQGGLLSPIKFIDRDSVEYSLVVAAEQDQNEKRMATLTLNNALALIDPAWGGVYQYSTQSRWDLPHFRKTMAAQSGHLRLYSLAYAQLKFKDYLETTDLIQSYIKNYMTSDCGAFYTGQTDSVNGTNPGLFFSMKDQQRKAIGIPDIDKRILTRENGWMIEALATHYEYCGDKKSLDMAITAANWINDHCRLNTGGYVTNALTEQAFYLADTLAMARAMLQLYRTTFNEHYLDYVSKSIEFINNNFKNDICGFNSKINLNTDQTSPRQMDENISLTRFANLLGYYSDNDEYKKMAKHGLRYLCIPEIATARMEEAGILLVDREIQSAPITINLYGHKDNPLFNEFRDIAYKHPGWYKLIRCHHSKLVYASIEIDGFISKPVTKTKRLKQLLLDC